MSTYKKALHSFFLKVHPDFFTGQREVQRVNEASIAQLNELLAWAKEFKAGTLKQPPNNTISFTFYQSMEGDVPPGKISSKFEVPTGFQPTDNHRTTVERAVNKFLRDLLRRANCIDDGTTAASEAAEAAKEAEEVRPMRARGRSRRTNRKTKTLMDDAAESLAEKWTTQPVPTVDELVESDQVLLSRTLSPIESAAALQTLTGNLGSLQYHRWSGMPLLIADHYAIGEVTGSLTVPWDFTPGSFLAFLNANDKAVVACREAAETFAKSMEALIGEIGRTLDIDDVLISCPHRDAKPCLELILRNTKKFVDSGVSNLTLEIGNKWGYRRNGVVIVDHKTDQKGMIRALKTLAPHSAKLQKMYQLAKRMLESIEWHIGQCYEAFKPLNIDVFTLDADDGATTYAQRLRFVKELFAVSPQLAQWDWSEFTFVLGTSLRLDWDARTFCLPHNFDGQALLRYVGDVHEGAKETVRNKLVQESAIAQAHHDRIEQEHDALRLAHANESIMHPQQASSEDVQGALTGYGEEYMTSPAVASSDSFEEHRVERPLHHGVSFGSDEDAREQLEWEGFHKSPYAEMVPLAEADDYYATSRAMNRKHREEAVKEIIREMRDESGYSKRFKGFKMGDVMGINNSNELPTGFPTLAPGTQKPKDKSEVNLFKARPPHRK